MRYTHKQKSAILQKIIDKISKEIFHITEDSEIDANLKIKFIKRRS